MNIFKVDKNLYDIRLDLEEVHIKNFLSSWVYKDKELCYLVDPGLQFKNQYSRTIIIMDSNYRRFILNKREI